MAPTTMKNTRTTTTGAWPHPRRGRSLHRTSERGIWAVKWSFVALFVIANLAVYFATQVLFPEGVSLAGLDLFALSVAVVSFVVVRRFKVPIYIMVPAGAVVGMAWTLL
jgi:hypothetical protein